MKNKAICCCESAGIEVEGAPVIHAVCHCSNCKKRTGSAFGISAYFKDSQIINTFGETGIYKINNKNIQDRYFCKKCGTTLYWKVSALPGLTGIAGGCFSHDSLPKPKYTVSNDSKCTWLELPNKWKTSLTKRDLQ